MRKHHFYILGLFVSAAVLAQSLPRTLPILDKPGYSGGGPSSQPVIRTSRIRGQEYFSILEKAAVGHEWESTTPLPISLSTAEKVARAELGKVLSDSSEWIATDFHISRFGEGPAWYYAVTLKPVLQLSGETPESFTVLVDFAGTPGRVGKLTAQR